MSLCRSIPFQSISICRSFLSIAILATMDGVDLLDLCSSDIKSSDLLNPPIYIYIPAHCSATPLTGPVKVRQQCRVPYAPMAPPRHPLVSTKLNFDCVSSLRWVCCRAVVRLVGQWWGCDGIAMVGHWRMVSSTTGQRKPMFEKHGFRLAYAHAGACEVQH